MAASRRTDKKNVLFTSARRATMEHESWEKVRRTFFKAIRRPLEQRSHFLDRSCKQDTSLRREVESLLASYDRAATFMESPAFRPRRLEKRRKLEAGEEFNHYRIIRQIGSGGMGDVYLAEDTILERKVALKLMPENVAADGEDLQRFEQEARAASALNHPNILTVYEVGADEGCRFIVTEFIEGESLRERLKRARVKPDQALEIAIQVAMALETAHENGIIHRDIKPENIMIRHDGLVKVLDFGLAKLMDAPFWEKADSKASTKQMVSTAPGIILGTPGYMSPEQTRGKETDARTDIWSLGCVLYEMLAGKRPFEGETGSDAIAAILTSDPPPLSGYVPDLPNELERIVDATLRKDVDARYHGIGDLLTELRSVQENLEFAAKLEQSGVGLILEPLGEVRQINSIAVLPFQNATGCQEIEYISDGIAESLINNLAQLEQLRVIARSTAFSYKDKDLVPQAIGRELKVQTLLTGCVRQSGDKLWVQVDLVDASTGSQLWGEEYERPVSEVLRMRQAITEDVTKKLKLRLSGEQQKSLIRRDTSNSEAYRLYLKGRHLWEKRTAVNLKKAIAYFEQSIDCDASYALAYVGLADSFVLLEDYAGTPPCQTLPKARAAAQQALQINEQLAEAHASLGLIEAKSWNFDEAEREYRRAIELNSNYPTTHLWYGLYLRMRGRFKEATSEMKRAQDLDPLSSATSTNIARNYLATGEFDTAIAEAEKVLELDPDFPGAHHVLGSAYWSEGKRDDAFGELERAVELSGRHSFELEQLGVRCSAAGMTDRAGAILKELEAKYESSEALGRSVASLYAALGDKEQAFAWLEKDFQNHSGPLPEIAFDPEETALRKALSDDPRWSDLLRRIGLQS